MLLLFVGGSFLLMLAIVVLSSLAIFHQDEASQREDREVAEVKDSPETPLNIPKPVSTEPGDSWMASAFADLCATPCSGGVACPTPDTKLERCISGVTCVAGSPSDTFQPSDSVALHLSAIHWGDDRTLEPCKTGRDLWICVQAEGELDEECTAQLEACQQAPNGAALSQKRIVLKADQLMHTGVK